MFNNYLKIAFRNLFRQKAYSIINIFGLALGLAACILVGLCIWQDFNYDNYHQNGDNIYRVNAKTIRSFYSISWDGKDENNKPVSSGLYFYKLRNGTKQITKKIILLK